MDVIKHIFITGEIASGKSTLIRKLLLNARQSAFGFQTEKVNMTEPGDAKLYIHPACGDKVYSHENVAGFISVKGKTAYADVFDSIGARLLTDIPAGAIVLMDELGFMESTALVFCNTVLRILDGPYYVLAAVKTKDTPFLNRVRAHQNALVYNISAENRNDLYERILLDLRRFDPESPFLPECPGY